MAEITLFHTDADIVKLHETILAQYERLSTWRDMLRKLMKTGYAMGDPDELAELNTLQIKIVRLDEQLYHNVRRYLRVQGKPELPLDIVRSCALMHMLGG